MSDRLDLKAGWTRPQQLLVSSMSTSSESFGLVCRRNNAKMKEEFHTSLSDSRLGVKLK